MNGGNDYHLHVITQEIQAGVARRGSGQAARVGVEFQVSSFKFQVADLSRQRIPDLLESKALEVLHIPGCEVGYSVVSEGQGKTDVVDPKTRMALRCMRPKILGDRRRVIEHSPAWVMSKRLDNGGGIPTGERAFANLGIAEERVQFQQDEFAHRNRRIVLAPLQEFACGGVIIGTRFERGQKDVRVE